MELTGLTLGQMLGVLGGAGALVTLLYFLRLRRRRVAVPFVKLWETVLAERQTTRLLSQLKRWISLLIALAVVGLLAFALGDPRWAGATDDARSLAVLVDASASMQSTDIEPSRFERAKREVRDLIDGLGPADRMLLAQMDSTTRPVSPMSDEPRILRRAVDELEPTDAAADLETGMRLALDALRGEPNPEIVIITDGRLDEASALQARARKADAQVSWIRLGEDGSNVAISAFSVRRYPLDKSQSEVLVELWNPSEERRRVELTLFGDGEAVKVQEIEVPKEKRLRRFFSNISGVDQTLEARIEPVDGKPDVLAADDRAYARLPRRTRARVLAVTDGNLYLQAALLLDEYLDVTEIAPSEYPTEQPHDVVIFDRFVPSTRPEVPALYIHPRPPEGVDGPFRIRGTVERPYFNQVDRDHPVVRWTALNDVNVEQALRIDPRRDDHVIARDGKVPLLLSGRRNGHRVVCLTFDVRRSDLPLRIAWPLLVLNSIDWFTRESDDYVSSYRIGDTWHIPVDSSLERATIVSPRGRKRSVPVVDGRAVYSGMHAGLYRIRTPQGERTFAANMGPSEESRVAPPQQLQVAGIRAGAPSESAPGLRTDIWIYLVLAALAVLLVEWLTYHRRWTV